MNFVIVSKQNCIWCIKVKNLLKQYPQVTVFEYNLNEVDIVLLDFIKAAGFKTVPIVISNGQLIGGYEETKTFLTILFGGVDEDKKE